MDTLKPIAANGKIDPATLGFDVDGVIADTMGLFLELARREYGVRDLRYEAITCYRLADCLPGIETPVIDDILERILGGDYTIALEPIRGARQVLSRMASRNLPIRMVTARSHPGPIQEWVLRRLALPAEAVELVATGSFDHKAPVLIEKGIRCFVEDRLETCFALETAGIRPVLFRQPWNREPHPFTEVGTWAELESLMRW